MNFGGAVVCEWRIRRDLCSEVRVTRRTRRLRPKYYIYARAYIYRFVYNTRWEGRWIRFILKKKKRSTRFFGEILNYTVARANKQKKNRLQNKAVHTHTHKVANSDERRGEQRSTGRGERFSKRAVRRVTVFSRSDAYNGSVK